MPFIQLLRFSARTLLLTMGTAALNAQAKPDLVLLNGKIFTSVAAHPYVQALAICGDRILATGDTKTFEKMAGPSRHQRRTPSL